MLPRSRLQILRYIMRTGSTHFISTPEDYNADGPQIILKTTSSLENPNELYPILLVNFKMTWILAFEVPPPFINVIELNYRKYQQQREKKKKRYFHLITSGAFA